MTHFCEEFIEAGGDPWAGTYCKLRAGHAGDHSAHYPETTTRHDPDTPGGPREDEGFE